MNYQKCIAILKRQTSSQPYKSQIKFAVLICQKLYFNYQKFTKAYEWGNADLLMDAIKICQQGIENHLDINQIKSLITQIDSIIPDMDDFGSAASPILRWRWKGFPSR